MRIGEIGSQQVQDHPADRLARGIIDTIRQPILILNDQLKVESANRFFYETFEVTAEQTEGRFVYELGNRQWDIPPLRLLLEKIIPQQSSIDDLLIQHTFEHIGERLMMLNARRLEMPGGEPAMILLAIEDLTASHRLRQQLKSSEERYRTFVEEVNSIIIGFDRRGVITFFNRFSERLFGYSREEVVGKRCFVGTIIPEIDSRGVNNTHLIEDIFSNPEKYYRNDSEGICRSGNIIHFSWNTKLQRDSTGIISEILIDGNDITELTRTRTELEQKAVTLDTLLNFIPEGIIITDRNHRVQVVSRYTEKLLGLATDDLIHANEAERLTALPMYWPGTSRKVLADELPLSKSITTGETYEDFHVEFKNGSLEKALSVNSAPIFDKQGHIIGAIGGWRDITDRRLYVVEIERRKRVLDAILDYAPVGIMLVDREGVITDVSRMLCRYFGMTADQIVGHEEQSETWGILHSSTRKPLHSLLMPLCREIRKKETIREEEFSMIRDGRERVYAVSASPIFDTERKVVGAVTVWRDISERKEFEARLRRNEQRLQSMFGLHKAIMLLIDPHTGRIKDANESAVSFYGFGRNELRSMSIDDLNQLSSDQVKQEMQRALHEERDYFVFPHRLKDGQIRWVEVYSSPVKSDGEPVLFSIIHDVTERKEAQEALRASEERFRGIFDNVALGIAETDVADNFVAVNDSLCKMLGYGRDELLKTDVHHLTAPEDRLVSDRINEKIHRNEASTINYEKRLLKKDGSPLWVNVTVSAIRDIRNIRFGSVKTIEDITERKKTQESLRASEERFRNLADNISQLAWMADADGRIFWYNKRWYDYTGTTPEQMLAGKRGDVLHPGHVERVARRIRHSWNTGELWEDTFPLRGKEGEYRWFLSRAVPIRNESGQIVRWFGTNTDITEMREAQEEIQKRRAEVEAILGSLPDGYIIYDQYGRIVQMNERAEQVIGFTDEDKSLSYEERMQDLRMVAPDGKPFPLSQIPSWKALHGEVTRDVVMKIERPDRQFWISVSASPITTEGRTLGAIMEFSDITRMHTLQEQLSNERTFVNAILQTSGALILVTDEYGTIVRINRACEHLSGYSEQELMGRCFYDLLISEQERGGIEEAYRKLREGAQVVEHENHWVTKSGEKRFIRWRNTLLRDKQTEETYIVSTGIDISDRLLLEHQLNRRAEELAAAYKELESFSYSVSHDLRSPLHTIASFTSILREDYAGRLDKEGQEYVQYIENGIRKMERLISDLLSLSRISRQEMVRSDVNLSALVSAFLHELHQTSPRRKVEFDIEDNVHASGDERLLDVAVKNLLRNAWKFTGKNELTRIEFGTFDREGKTTYFIRDNGVGFDNKFAQKIFEPFKRTHTDKDFGGTGVGLSIVERVVIRHGGQIWAEGEVGGGAGFYFTLE